MKDWIFQAKWRVLRALRAINRAEWMPSVFRSGALRSALYIAPLAGAAGQNGAVVVLKINTLGTGGEGFVLIGGQGNLSISESTAEIDVSDKLSGRLGERVAGRASASVSVDFNFQRDDEGQTYLKDKYRNRENVEILIFDRDDPTVLTGTNIEKCTGLITNLSEEHPDQEASSYACEINLNNEWEAA